MRGLLRAAVVLSFMLAAGSAATAQENSSSPGALPLLQQLNGATVDHITVVLGTSSGNKNRDRAAVEAARQLFSTLDGQKISSPDLSRLVGRLQQQATVSNASYRLLPGATTANVGIIFTVDVAPVQPESKKASGVFTREIGDFPTLYKDDRSLLTAIVAGGLGVYSDSNAWFGQPLLFNKFSPIAGHLPGRSNQWTEGSLEIGAGFAQQLGDSPVYAFGALTGMKTWSVGQDIFRNDSRNFDDVEKAYVGLLYADRTTKDKLKLSVGRQTYTLNDGFLVNVVKGSSNAGERGATYLGPRLTNDFSVLADGRFGKWGFNAFYIDPNELESIESNSTFLGFNGKYSFNDNVAVDGTFITIPNSKSTFANPYGLTLPRQDLDTVSGHAKWRNFGMDGVLLEGEFARQFHPDYAMSAYAYYGTVGYIARTVPWTPSISYRYAYLSGDDPNTRTYERFDPLLSTGLGIWLQGISFGKLFSNSNLATHRIQFNVAPTESLNLTLDLHLLRAPQLNNLGSNPALTILSSHELGEEATLSARWAINRNLYLQALASYATPGKALRDIGANKAWSTYQLSLYWGL